MSVASGPQQQQPSPAVVVSVDDIFGTDVQSDILPAVHVDQKRDPSDAINLYIMGQILITEQTYADVKVIVYDGKGGPISKTFSVHSVILAGASDVVAEAIYGAEFNKKGQQCASPHPLRDVEIFDISADAVATWLKFEYTDNIDIAGKDVVDLVNLANKFNLPRLRARCHNFLYNGIDTMNACRLYQDGQTRLGLPMLGLAFIMRHGSEIFSNLRAHLDLEMPYLKHLLMKDELQVNEIEVFNAIRTWIDHRYPSGNSSNSNNHNFHRERTEAMEELLPVVRLSLIPTATLFTTFGDFALVSKPDLLELCAYSGASDKVRRTMPMKGHNTLPRYMPFTWTTTDALNKVVVQTANKETHAVRFQASGGSEVPLVGELLGNRKSYWSVVSKRSCFVGVTTADRPNLIAKEGNAYGIEKSMVYMPSKAPVKQFFPVHDYEILNVTVDLEAHTLSLSSPASDSMAVIKISPIHIGMLRPFIALNHGTVEVEMFPYHIIPRPEQENDKDNDNRLSNVGEGGEERGDRGEGE